MRLDLYLSTLYSVSSRTRAANLIELGRVTVNGRVVTKASYAVKGGDEIKITEDYEASLGGIKLKEALEKFNIDARGMICADVGASNGGFTDVLLQAGAESVYAIDVGECALPDFLKNNSKVKIMDRTNARFLEKKNFSPLPELSVIDVSFISLKLVLPAVVGIMEKGNIIALIKPQFECEKRDLTKKGILLDNKKREKILVDIENFCRDLNLTSSGIIPAPHPFENKNKEYFICLKI